VMDRGCLCKSLEQCRECPGGQHSDGEAGLERREDALTRCR
jgi:hypothetical protein